MSRVIHRILPLVVALGLAACSNPVAPTVPTNRTLQPGERGARRRDHLLRAGWHLLQERIQRRERPLQLTGEAQTSARTRRACATVSVCADRDSSADVRRRTLFISTSA